MNRLSKFFIIISGYILLYLVCSFVAWDFNPLNWWILSNWFGRLVCSIALIYIFVLSLIAIFTYD